MDSSMILAKQPAILPLYMACLLKKADPIAQNNQIRDLTLTFSGCKIDQNKLKKFRQFYDLQGSGGTVPATFIHLLVFRPQLKFLLNRTLPFPVMGLVHLFNDIIVHHEIAMSDKLDIEISVKEFSESSKGKQITIHTRVLVGNQLTWESNSGFLYPKKIKTKKKPSSENATHNEKNQKTWHLPSNLGRKFALLSGDANPIHTYKLAAKLFGFRQAIAHGMCMALKSASELSTKRKNSQPLKRLYVEFKKPVFLPNTVSFNHENLELDTVGFKVTSKDEKQTCLLKGYCSY